MILAHWTRWDCVHRIVITIHFQNKRISVLVRNLLVLLSPMLESQLYNVGRSLMDMNDLYWHVNQFCNVIKQLT